ncbi:MAG: response regulator [Myxococcales bacterium]|nr:response regulator [Myxococcales bacterium]
MLQNHPSEGKCSARPRPRWSGLRILVVDEDRASLDQAAEILARVGAEVTVLSEEERAEAEVRRGAYQLVLLAVRAGGLHTLERIRRADGDVSVVVVTADPDTDTAIAALKLDVADYLEKPCLPDLLCETVERIARKKGLPTTSDDRVLRAIGDNVRGLRLGAGLTLKQLGARAGLSMSLISQVERGESSPSIGSLHRIARSLDVGLSELFRGVDP